MTRVGLRAADFDFRLDRFRTHPKKLVAAKHKNAHLLARGNKRIRENVKR
jgi:hypothetical protein